MPSSRAGTADITNAGTIQAAGTGGIAICRQRHRYRRQIGDRRRHGHHQGGNAGISARTVDITANAGIIEATGGLRPSPPQTPLRSNNTSTGTIRSKACEDY